MNEGSNSASRSRYVRIASLAFCLALLVALGVTGLAGPAVQAIESVAITVDDMDRSLAFYRAVLGFTLESDVEVTGPAYERLEGVFGLRLRVVRLRLGDERIELHDYLTPRGRPVAADSRSNDLWFQHIAIIVSDMDRAYRHLREHGVEHASTGPQTLPAWNERAAGIRAFYFKDPDQHTLEVLQFPPGKGDPKWQRADGRLFLGIDHTAIAVSSTDASLRFYRDALGLEIVGESENHGEEQERLNQVFGARLRITTLRARSGFGIELLEYLTPRDGRSPPADSRANDLWHWQTRLSTLDAEAAARELRARRVTFRSPGVIALPDGALGFVKALQLSDADDHRIELAQASQGDGNDAGADR